MKITKEMTNYVYAHSAWSEDFKQDILLELLEMPEQEVLRLPSLIERVARGNLDNLSKTEIRRREIEEESFKEIMQGLGLEGTSDDSASVLDAEQEIERRIAQLSRVHRRTMEALCYEGIDVADFAATEGVSPDVIYKRLERIRKEMLS